MARPVPRAPTLTDVPTEPTVAADRASPFVEFLGVCKSYDGDTLAVANVDLAIAKGEFVTFLGPSGSGKTTSLMMLAGFETPTAGDIRLAGRSVRHIPPHRRNIGMVFQNYALFPHMTVAQNIGFPLSVRGAKREDIAKRVDRALSLVRLDGFGHRRPSELSGGQQQRVALARAVVFDPDLVLMDEPLGALDKQLREQLQLEIKHIHADLGVTIVYVTHDQSEALTLSDRIAVFKDGAIQQIGGAVEIYERPATSFVAQFIGESNRLDGTVVAREGDRCVVRVDGDLLVKAVPVAVGDMGSRTTLSIRPEHVVIDPTDSHWDNVVPARLENLIYHGDHARAQFRLGAGQIFTVKISNPRHAGAFAVGVDVRLAWRATDCRALDPLAASTTPSS
ncbi:MAG TPA: ABC transporter ATP-binding protein [Vineibacter sp.]|nr:ABC transporter ATP-binding protein [Vineibacter sp.]